MLSRLKAKLGTLGIGLLISAVAGAGLVAAVSVPATAQPVASSAQWFGSMQRALGMSQRANRVANVANRRAVHGIRIARAAHQRAGQPGPEGPQGPEGEPWTPENTLPSGAMLTGSWHVLANEATAIGFPLPLEEPLTNTEVHLASDSDFSDFCEGSIEIPDANAGHLCVYVAGASVDEISNPTSATPEEGAARSGALIESGSNSFGTWAVRAP